MNEFKPVIKNSFFVSLWSSQILSQVTINIMNFLLLLKLFTETESTIATSFLWVAYALPAIIIGPFAAASVDMIDKKKILTITNLLQALTIFLYAISHKRSLFVLYAIAIVYSFFNQFYVPAEQASLPFIVKKKNLPFANSLFFITQQAAIIFGFGVAGILLKFLGFDYSLYLCSIFLFFAFLSVRLLPSMESRDKIPTNFEMAFEKFFRRIIQGYQFLKDNLSILTPFLLLIGLQVVVAVIVVNVPLLATDILRVSVENAGLFIVIPTALGTFASGFIVPRLLRGGWRKRRLIEISLAALSLTALFFAFGVSLFSGFWVRLIVGMVTISLTGMSFIGILVPSQTFIQEKTPGGMRGRVFGNFWFLVTIATIFPVIFSGAISELFGIRALLLIVSFFPLAILFLAKKYGQSILVRGISNGK